jgi:photosystem II stability/assembly factor-like uncharacterized protein
MHPVMIRSFLLFFFILCFAEVSSAQEWVQTGGPGGGYFQVFFNAKKDIFILTPPHLFGAFIRSTNNGKTWSNIAPSDSPEGISWWNVAIAPNQEIYVRGSYHDTDDFTRSVIWRSSDNGNSWTRLGLHGDAQLAFISTDNTIYVSSHDDTEYYYHFLRSKNSATGWDTLVFPLPVTSPINGVIDTNGVIFINDDSGSLVSRDQGNSWQQIAYKISYCGKKGNIFASTSASTFHSSDDGMTWNKLVFPSEGKTLTNSAGLLFFYRSKQYNYPRSDTLLYSTDDGTTWKDMALPSSKRWEDKYTFKIFGDADSGLYYYQYNDGEMFHASYPGARWEPAVFPTGMVSDLTVFRNGSLAALTPVPCTDCYIDPTLWNSDSLQSNWQFNDIFSEKFYKDSSDNVFLKEFDNVYTSHDTGKTWNPTWKNLISTAYSLAFFKDIILAALDNYLEASYDVGISWVIQNGAGGYYYLGDLMASHDGLLYGTGGYNLYRSSDRGITFQMLANPFSPNNRISLMVTNLYGEVFASGSNSFDIYRSTDQGEAWSFFSKGLTCTNINTLIELPDGSIAAATDSGVFILPLGGCQWYSYSKGLWTKNVPCIGVSTKGELYAGSDGCGIFKSTKLFNKSPKLIAMLVGSIDYNTVNVNSDTCMDITLRNRGSNSFTINSFTVTDPIPFSISDESAKKIPITLNPKDSVVMTVCFHPPQPAQYTSSIIWNTDIDPALCGISRETKLHGIAIQQSTVQTSSFSEFTFSLHPNPAAGNSLTITFSGVLPSPSEISIYDVLGREVYRNVIITGSKEFVFTIQDLSEGIYHARTELNGKTMTEKFVKVK